MPIVIIIMPQLWLASRNLLLYLSVTITPWIRKQIVGILAIRGIFSFTVAAQFALHVIVTAPQIPVC